MAVLGFAAGLALLVGGAELLVRGASRIAKRLGIPRLVVGLTIVAFGTSAPELAVTTSAAIEGSTDVAFGNVVGSNIFNVLGILGAAAIVAPLTVSVGLIRRDIPLMVAVSGLVLVLGLDGAIGRGEGALLLAVLVIYTALQIREAMRGRRAATVSPNSSRALASILDVGLVVVGLALLVAGAALFVDAARELASSAGVSELVIGLTIVAAGTSAPELATSVIASLRGERDIAVGNVVGSNLFNLLAVLGVGAVAAGELEVASLTLRVDLPVMVGAAVVCLPLAITGRAVVRWEGAVLVAAYAAFVVYLVLARSS